MYSPIVRTRTRRLGWHLVYELMQLAVWVDLALRPGGSLRSAWGGGMLMGRPGPNQPIRPRKTPKKDRPTGLAAASA